MGTDLMKAGSEKIISISINLEIFSDDHIVFHREATSVTNARTGGLCR